MEQSLILGFALGFSVGSFFIWGGLLFLGFVRVPAGHVLGVTRSGPDGGPGMAFVRSGATLVMPFFHRGELYPVSLAPVSRKGLTITRAGVGRLVCDLEAEVHPATGDDGLIGYIQAFGGHELDEISGIAARIIENGARQVLQLMPVEQVLADPERATAQLQDHLAEELRPLGLQFKALHLKVRPAPSVARTRDISEFSMDGFQTG